MLFDFKVASFVCKYGAKKLRLSIYESTLEFHLTADRVNTASRIRCMLWSLQVAERLPRYVPAKLTITPPKSARFKALTLF